MPDNDVLSVIEREPPDIREGLMELRRLILETAAETDGSGKVVETLKMGPAELPDGKTQIRYDNPHCERWFRVGRHCALCFLQHQSCVGMARSLPIPHLWR